MSHHPEIIVDRRVARAFACAVALSATLSATACRPAEEAAPMPEPEGKLVLDLVAELAVATVNQETSILDLGEPSARRHLISGWSTDQEDADGTYVWGLGDSASLSFFAAAPTAFTLGLRCKPLAFDGAPDQTLTIDVGGKPLGEIRLEREMTPYRLEVPEDHVASGQNRLDLGFGYHRRPRDVIAGATDERDLAVRCYSVELDGLGSSASPRVAAGAGAAPDRLELPAGTVVTYYFDHAANSDLAIGALEAWGPDAGDARLLVRYRSAEAMVEATLVVDRYGPPLRIPLATAGPAIDSLELAVVSDDRGRRPGWLGRLLGAHSEASGLTLVHPSIRADAGAVASESPAPEAAPVAVARPNVIVYLIDTLRADHLGAYGYPRPTSPNIDRFAADAVLFENARAQSSWTRPAVVSVLTGLEPQTHGVNRRRDALASSVDTLAELLHAEGYETAGFVTNGNAGPEFGLGQGFELFRYLRESGRTPERHQLSDQLNRWLFDWLEHRDDEARPFLLYAHATDPHVPYTPAEPFRQRFAPDADPEIGLLANVRAVIQGRREATERDRRDLVDLYDAEIAFNDHHFGQLIDRLKELGLYDASLIVLVSDHGEEFLDHGGWEHGVTLYDEQLRVPLIVKRPGGRDAGTRVATTARQIDVMPTVLDLLGVAGPVVDGVSLLDRSPASGRASFAYLSLQHRQMRSVTRKGWKLIFDDSPVPRGRPLQLYGLESDPGETTELAVTRPFERELLAQVMRRRELDLAHGLQAEGEQAEIPEELRRQLEALGYL